MNLLSSFIQSLLKEELDKALELSNKRREKFKKTFLQKDTPRVNKNALSESKIRLIFKLLSEQPFPPPPAPGTPPGAPAIDPAGMLPPAPGGDLPPPDAGMAPLDTPPEEEGSEDEGDPIVNILNNMKKTLETTTDIAELVKQAKGEIQTKFEKPTHALGLIQALADTHNPVLRNVAARLLLFIKETL